MATRILGPTGSKRRLRFLLAPVLVAALAAVFLVSGAQAVHDTGLFELDGNATSASGNTGTPPDDWDRVCHEVLSSDCSTTANTNGATAVSWTAEPNLSSSIFTGGGSKDPQNISNWAWKDAGGLPDKDNLLHGFATRYSVDSNSHCPGPGGNTDGTKKCDVLYFGSDRYDNSGDAQQGFWFFQNKITQGSTPSGGGFNFNGVHKSGDLLVISDFSNGGTTSFISVFKWDPTCTATNKPDGTCADANLRTLSTSGNARCDLQQPGDAFCGLVNSGTITMPWSFTDKSNTASNGALNGEFYEGGINLSAFNLGGECFSSIASETRSSTSTTATLKDFVLGQFAVCGASLKTTPSGDGTLSGVNGSATVSDSAAITVSGLANPPAPTGSVKFYLCGPSTTALTSCDATGSLKSTVDLSTATQVGNVFTAGSGNVTVNSSGYYCWFATWPGDGNYDPSPATAFSDGSSTECFKITQPTSVSTTLHETNSSGTDVVPANNGTTITIDANGYVTDYATVSPTGATGSVAFKYYTSAADCNADTNGTSAGGGTVSNGSAHSTPTQFTSSGTFYWRAFFTGTGLNLDSSSDCSEILTVNQPTSVSTTLHETDSGGTDVVPANNGVTITIHVGSYVTDYASVTPSSATGTVAFKYYNSAADCNADTNGTSAGGGAVSGGSATSTATQFNSSGTFYWRAFFTGSGLNLNSSSDCSEILTVNQPTSVSTTLHETDSLGTDVVPNNNGTTITVFPGAYVTDYASVTPSSATGSVAFKYYNSAADCNADTNGTSAGGGAVSGGSATSTPTLFTVTGTFYWRAFFTGTGLNLDSSSDCSEILTVNQLQPTMDTAQRFVPNDSATISVVSGAGNLNGNVVFKLYVNDPTCTDGNGQPAYTSGSIDITDGLPNSGTPGLTKTVSSGNTTAYDQNGTTFSWVVTYTSNNAGHKNVSSPCTNETSSISIDNGAQQP
jgi:hypothetical protein